MPFSAIGGKTGSVLIGSTTYCFSKWSLNMKANTPKVTNFCSQGFRDLVSGIKEASIEIEGPYDAGSMALTVGNSYNLTLGWNDTLTLTGQGILSSLVPSLDVEDAGRVKATFESTGPFSASIT